ncbi:hypothetical protein HPG69_012486 [Diceros bicornis minor]|uniref:Opioid growth factor receptor (OGFr) conserved domain-containing protein n=1 Tax=Diceros bicornis minor TaxID=77932 RepID=A0A7J7EEJ6_DICBM|nr:hypothetical protein HPG69_012486 [Diceros bicornis minor]
MEDLDCDSTWEEDEEEDGESPSAGGDEDGEAGGLGDADAEDEEEAPPRALQSRMVGSRNRRAMQDTRRYRHHYPDLVERDGNGDTPNLKFYQNDIPFKPNGCRIKDILQNWENDYDLLENNHSYIQWLFPLREQGVNRCAEPLTLREIEEFKSSKDIRERFVKAYELMLGFYGIELQDQNTGKVCRADNYQKRFQNLDRHSHNNLRITRILKSLGELGLEHYQAPLARFFLEETLVHGELPGVRQSALDYFVFTVRSRRQRRELLHYAWEHFKPRYKFVWGPHDKLKRFRPHSPPCPPLPVGPRLAEGKESCGDPLLVACTQGRTCEPEREEEGDSVAQGSQPVSAEPQEASAEPQEASAEPREAGPLERDQGDEARGCGEKGLEPSSPKESKKRKLEVNQREQALGEPAPQGASEVEKIAQNLEGCALSQGSLRAGTQEMGSPDPGEPEKPCPQPPGAKVTDEVRKRRKVDPGARDETEVAAGGEAQTPAPASPPAPSGHPEAREGENGIKEEAEGPAGQEQGAPRSPETAGPTADERAEATESGPSPEPRKP